jgi:DNA-binding beta-propeller fold protein YncE
MVGAGDMAMKLPRFPTLAASAALLSSIVAAQLPPANTTHLYVSDFDNDRVVVYDAAGAFLRSFTAPGLNGPRGVAFLPDQRIAVASQLGHRVFVFTREESPAGSFAAPELVSPTGMAVSPSGELHVASFNNARICVFDLAGGFRRSYSAPGFSTPNCVMFDSAGNIYSTSAATGLVFKFAPDESFTTAFGAPSPPGLTSPMGIARDANDCVYVAGGSSNNIVKFTPEGAFLGSLSHPDLTGPQGIAFDDRGHFFSSSFYQDVLVEFDELDAYVRTITSGGLSVPRSLAFRPGGPGLRAASGSPSVVPGVAAVRNGSGRNAHRLRSRHAPRIGEAFEVLVDCRGHADGRALLVAGTPASARARAAGELLLDRGKALFFRSALDHQGGVARVEIAIPYDPSLIGIRMRLQALVGGSPGAELSNALDVVLGG